MINKPTLTPTPTPGWFDNLSYTDEIETKYARALVYGPMGSGKTRFSLTWPKPFVIDIDHGLLTGRKTRTPSVALYPPKDRKDRNKVYQTVMDILIDARDRSGPFAPDEPLHDRETIVLDGYTSLADALMKEILILDGKDFIQEKPEYHHWNTLSAKLESITQVSAMIPFNFVGTCGNKLEKDEYTGGWIGLPDIIGGYRGDIGYRFDEVYYFEPRRGKTSDAAEKGSLVYEAHTAKYRIFDAKSRLDLPSLIVNPTYDILHKLIQEAV